MAMIELGKVEAADAIETPRPWEMVVDLPEQASWQLPLDSRIVDIYTKLNEGADHSLLILGAPGAGKTTTLLELVN